MIAAAVADPDLVTPAKVLFGKPALPSDQPTQPIGAYAKGCLAGAKPLPLDGPHWQVMRLSRNRHWGTPRLIDYIERLSNDAAELDHRTGILIGDMSQPRGGPMASGHASHQIGLDVDIWFVPMPTHTLTANERETIAAPSLLIPHQLAVDPAKWSDQDFAILKRAASYPEVARIFVSAAIKKQVCDTAGGDRTWLRKIRPWTAHDDHFHVRLDCPPGMASCVGQPAPGAGDGCGAELAEWFKPKPPPKPPTKPVKPVKPPPPLTLAGLPKACTDVLYAKDAPILVGGAAGDDALGKLIGKDETGASITK
jgi:penicillin-insensitive murein DD-endopeptidase